MMTTITVSPAYQGIPGVAHGGYLAGRLAQFSREPTRVMLRKPPPLDVRLSIEDCDEGLRLLDPQRRTIMEAWPAGTVNRRLPAVTLDEVLSREPHPGFADHPYPVCFVCGTARDDGFGLRVSAPDGDGLTVGTWSPSGPLLPDGQVVPSAFVWAVIDCLTAWSFADHWGEADWWPALTAQIVVELAAPVRRGEPHLVMGRLAGREGRRVAVDAWVADATGRPCASAKAVWVVVPTVPGASSAAASAGAAGEVGAVSAT